MMTSCATSASSAPLPPAPHRAPPPPPTPTPYPTPSANATGSNRELTHRMMTCDQVSASVSPEDFLRHFKALPPRRRPSHSSADEEPPHPPIRAEDPTLVDPQPRGHPLPPPKAHHPAARRHHRRRRRLRRQGRGTRASPHGGERQRRSLRQRSNDQRHERLSLGAQEGVGHSGRLLKAVRRPRAAGTRRPSRGRSC